MPGVAAGPSAALWLVYSPNGSQVLPELWPVPVLFCWLRDGRFCSPGPGDCFLSGQAVGPPGGGISSTGKTRAGLLQMRRRLRVCMRSSGRPGSDTPACLRLGKHRICPYKSSLPGVPLPWVTESRRGRLWPSESSISDIGPRLPPEPGPVYGPSGGSLVSTTVLLAWGCFPFWADRRPSGWWELCRI